MCDVRRSVSAKGITTALKTERKEPESLLFATWIIWLGLGMIGISVATMAHAGVQHRVLQKGRHFTPAAIDVQSGDSIEFVNDDGELLHHAYLENDRFSFDTGDQSPGSRTVVAFPTKGTFMVLCGIHPKMRLNVQVR